MCACVCGGREEGEGEVMKKGKKNLSYVSAGSGLQVLEMDSTVVLKSEAGDKLLLLQVRVDSQACAASNS